MSLQKISDASVFELGVSADNSHISLMETTDYWNSVDLDKAELGELIQELTEIHGKLKG